MLYFILQTVSFISFTVVFTSLIVGLNVRFILAINVDTVVAVCVEITIEIVVADFEADFKVDLIEFDVGIDAYWQVEITSPYIPK